MEEESINIVDVDEPEVQTTFTDFSVEEMVDEEGCVENVSY